MCSVTNVVFGLLWWSLWGPVEVTNRLIGALVSRGALASDSPTEARAELRAFLERLTPPEQRRFVYEVARQTFGGDSWLSRWDESVADLYGGEWVGRWFKPTDASLEVVFENDLSTLRAVTFGAVACARQIPSLHFASRRARAWLKSAGESCPAALAELLTKEDRSLSILRVQLGQPAPPTLEGRPASSSDEVKTALEDLWRDLSASPEKAS